MIRWLQAALAALALVCAVLPGNPVVVERVFSAGVYPLLQRAITPLSNLVPFALFDVITLAAAAALTIAVVRGIRRARHLRRWTALLPMLASIGTAAAVGYLVFLALWGFNYRRLPMTERLLLDAAPPATEAVVTLGRTAVGQANALYDARASSTPSEPWTDDALRTAFASVQGLLSDAPAAVPGRLKSTLYAPYFRWTSVDGMVNPFALEVLANPDLLPFERPFVAAHEWAHLAGYADESEANFVGWLTCLRADRAAQYSAWLFMYWQVSGELGAAARGELWRALDDGPRRDVEAIVARLQRGQLPILQRASWMVYDQYLRANRVEEGVRSYGAVITLILRARFSDGWTPVRRAPVAHER